jgi:hypothetical protein
MASDQAFEIEKGYDNRYEGLDFDDIDERPLHIAESQPEALSELPPPPSQRTNQDIHATLEALERAEALEEQLNAQKQPKARLVDRLEGKSKTTSTAAVSAVAAPLANSQSKLVDALAANSDLVSTIRNPYLFVAALTLELITQGTSRSTLLSKLASALRCLKTTTSEEELFKSLGLQNSSNYSGSNYKLDKKASQNLVIELKRAFELAEECKGQTTSTPQLEELTVRALLKLATAPVTANILSQCDQAGKKMRKLKNHPVQAVAQASEAVVKSWKQALSS